MDAYRIRSNGMYGYMVSATPSVIIMRIPVSSYEAREHVIERVPGDRTNFYLEKLDVRGLMVICNTRGE